MYNAPVIYAMIVPLAPAHPGLMLCRQICIRAHDVPRVPRGDYPVIDGTAPST